MQSGVSGPLMHEFRGWAGFPPPATEGGRMGEPERRTRNPARWKEKPKRKIDSLLEEFESAVRVLTKLSPEQGKPFDWDGVAFGMAVASRDEARDRLVALFDRALAGEGESN